MPAEPLTAPAALAPREDPPSGRYELPLLVSILVAAALIRLPGLFASLWYDEVMYSRVYFDNPGRRSWLFWRDVHPPVYALLLWLWSSLFGNHEAVLRLPSYLCGLGSLAVTWALARRCFGVGVALLACAILAFSPPHIWHSVESKTNMLAVFLSVLAVWSSARAVEPSSAGWRWPISWIVLVLALGTHAYVLAIAGTLAAWLGWRAWHERRLRRPAAATVAVIVLSWLPLFLWKMRSQGASLSRSYLRAFDLGELYRLLCLWFPHGNTLRNLSPFRPPSDVWQRPWAYFLLDGCCALALLWGLATAARGSWGHPDSAAGQRHSWGSRLLLLWLPPPLLAASLASLAIPHFYIERNFLPLLPAYAILLALGAMRLPRRWARGLAGTALLGLVLAGSLTMLLRHDTLTVHLPKVDWRSASAWLLAEGGRNGKLVVVTTSPTLEAEFYVRPTGPAHPTVAIHEYCSAPVLPIAYARQAGDSFWLVRNNWWHGCWNLADHRIRGGPGVLLQRERHFTGLDLYEFVAR